MQETVKSPNTYFSIPTSPSTIIPIAEFPPESFFHEEIKYPAIIVPAKETATLRKALKGRLIHTTSKPNVKAVYPLDDFDATLLPASEDKNRFRKLVLSNNKVLEKEDCPLQKIVHSFPASHIVITTSYQDWTVEQVLKAILPLSDITTAFEIIGHIAHLNLRDAQLPFQYMIGKVIYDKNSPRISTVVNKVGTIDNVYRTFAMQVIGGSSAPGWNIVTVKEESCIFQLDFQNVYWNSRLAGEHKRMVQYILSSSSTHVVVADAMAGVGPFAIPLTKQQQSSQTTTTTVYANDLNPASYQYLNINAKKNKCQNLSPFNLDARAFLHQLPENVNHVLMNLPASAPEFLDAFRGWTLATLPEVHVYCFDSKQSHAKEALERCTKALGCELPTTKIHVVRDVSPKKNMYCISFVLPEAVRALVKITVATTIVDNEEPDTKKQKLES